MSPFGGTPSQEAGFTEEDLGWHAAVLQERHAETGGHCRTYAGTDMIVLAVIERAHVEVGGLPAQDWALRVTLVYRREDGQWRLAHRHADPLGLPSRCSNRRHTGRR